MGLGSLTDALVAIASAGEGASDEGRWVMQHVPCSPPVLRIGPQRRNYKYEMLPQTKECQMATVWKCIKGAAGHADTDGKVLFLFKLAEGWFAAHGDARMNTALEVQTAFMDDLMTFAFFCRDPDALAKGWHAWDTYSVAAKVWAESPSLECETTVTQAADLLGIGSCR